MIKLDVEEYCHSCRHFSPTIVEKPSEYYANGELYCTIGDYVVKCKDHEKCAHACKFRKRGDKNGDDRQGSVF